MSNLTTQQIPNNPDATPPPRRLYFGRGVEAKAKVIHLAKARADLKAKAKAARAAGLRAKAARKRKATATPTPQAKATHTRHARATPLPGGGASRSKYGRRSAKADPKRPPPFFTVCRAVNAESSNDKLVLLLLAAYVVIWPKPGHEIVASVLRSRLLLESRLAPRTFQRSVKRLEASGAIRRIKDRAKDGTRLATKYALTPAAAPQIAYPKRTVTHPPPQGATVAPSTNTSRCQIEPKPGATGAPIRRVSEEAPLQGASSRHRPLGVTPLEANASAAHTEGAEDGRSDREVADTPLRRDISPPDGEPPASTAFVVNLMKDVKDKIAQSDRQNTAKARVAAHAEEKAKEQVRVADRIEQARVAHEEWWEEVRGGCEKAQAEEQARDAAAARESETP